MKYQKINDSNSLRIEADTIALYLADSMQTIQRIDLKLEEINEKAKEARELAQLDPATKTACDRIIANCDTERATVEAQLAGAQARLQTWRDREKSFNEDGGRAEMIREQKVENLRSKIGNDKLREPSNGEHAPGGTSFYNG